MMQTKQRKFRVQVGAKLERGPAQWRHNGIPYLKNCNASGQRGMLCQKGHGWPYCYWRYMKPWLFHQVVDLPVED